MLRIEGLKSGYGKSEVLHGVSMSINAGQVVTIIGANGAGKSTLVNTLSKLLPIMSGRIEFDGRDITALSASDVVDLGIIQVPEGRKLFGPLTVDENLTLGSYRVRHAPKAELTDRRKFVLDLFPRLAERATQRAATLSGGEQQMVALGRALMAGPRLLLLDELTLGLAPIVIDEMFETLERLKREGLTMLLVEQRADAALALADHAYVMATGDVVAEGPAPDLRNDERVRKAYLGESDITSD
ncbi:ABC transporter ATP-binding protein [Microvirga antarctica]|uniref:ABC transporter ATP-binding protein n=1 Tax=Microvirga antarctica TaxID=2819233 RepID=UPI001B305347|nr:ABC transporter ATP-binding protein [Microvirga antarctica]